MDFNQSPSAAARFISEVKRHYADISGAPQTTLLSFQNLVFGFLILLEQVGEDRTDPEEFLALDDEAIADTHGFTADERVPVYVAGGELMEAFRDMLLEQSVCSDVEEIDAVEEEVMGLFAAGPAGTDFFAAAATASGALDVAVIDKAIAADAVAATVADAAAAAAEPAPAPPQAKPILKRADTSRTRRRRHPHPHTHNGRSRTQRVRFSHTK